MRAAVHVAAAVIEGAGGRLLIARRPDSRHQGGFWEFPGGKVEPGEKVEEALCRELHEELAIEPLAWQPLIRVPFSYPDKRVLLDVWRVTRFHGEPRGMEGQPLRWVEVADLDPADFPPANRPIISALQLPDRCLITGSAENEEDFVRRLQGALERGVRLVQFRAPEMNDAEFRRRAFCARDLCYRYGARLLLNAEPALALEIEGAGLHLNRHRLMAVTTEALAPWQGRLVSASCHDEKELQRAGELGLDFALLSPVKPTPSHPGSPVLGWEPFAELVDGAPLPVYALGGVDASDIPRVQGLGGQGVAGIRAFW